MVKSSAVSKLIISHFRTPKDKIKAVLVSEPENRLTEDCWMSANGFSMFGITIHWITKDFKTCEVIFAMKNLVGQHTGVNLGNHLNLVLVEYNIAEKILCITTNNASNNSTMATQIGDLLLCFSSDKNLIGCPAHVINLSARAVLEVFSKHLESQVSLLPCTLVGLVDTPEVGDLHSTLSKIDSLTKFVKKLFERAHTSFTMALFTHVYHESINPDH